jgi:hypothetical protein
VSAYPLPVPVLPDLSLDAGSWCETEVDGRAARLITPPEQPLYRQLIACLEEQPLGPDIHLTVQEEAAALYALCVRYGSYYAVLTDDTKPVVDDGKGAGIADAEMARLNIEISAALAYLIDLFRTDRGRFDRLLARTILTLPLTKACDSRDRHFSVTMYLLSAPEEFRALPSIGTLLASDYGERQRKEAEQHPTRVLANALVNAAWRNGEIENQHALPGPRLLRYRRVSRTQETRIRRATISRFRDVMWALYALVRQRRPWPEVVLPFHVVPFLSVTPTGWSLVEETHGVTLLGSEESELLDADAARRPGRVGHHHPRGGGKPS